MRILLVHNPGAGSETHNAHELISALEKAGHTPVYQSSKKRGLRAALKEKPDVVLVAGGDGTVGKVARRLIGSDLSMSVLPLGTANNLARALGFHVPAKEIIAQLAQGKSEAFDVGRARGPWGKRFFFEAVGAGLFADYLLAPAEDADEAGSKAAELKRHVTEMRERFADHVARKWEIELDGEDVSGRYLFWQAMNIRSVGPALVMAPNAKTNDGKFDFLAAREDDRELVMDFLKARLRGIEAEPVLPVVRFNKMRLRWKKRPLHFDDEVWPEEKEKRTKRCEIEISVRPNALRIWKTEAKRRR